MSPSDCNLTRRAFLNQTASFGGRQNLGGMKADPIEGAKWHLIAKAVGDTNLELDDFVAKMDATARATAEKRAQPWLTFIKQAIAARTAAQQQEQLPNVAAPNAAAKK